MYLNLLRRFLTGLYALVIGLYLSVIVGHSIVQSRAPWTTAATPEPSTRIDAFTFDMQGSPWLLTNGPNKDKHQILHITETGTEKWDLPSGEESSGTWPPNYYGPELLEVDMNRQPWVALHPYGLLHWTEGGWQWFQFSGDLRIMKRVGSTLWVLTSDEQYNINSRLFSIDPETSEMLAMPLPEPEIQSGMIAYDFRVTPDDSLLVLASNGDRFSISVLKDNRWQGSPVALERSPGYLADVTRDASGNIWALTTEGGYCQTHYQIGLYEIQTDHWHWNDLSLNDYCDGELFTVSYEGMEIDIQQRIWLQTTGRLGVFDTSLGENPEPIRSYTVHNSNYQQGRYPMSNHIYQDAEGKMWVADESLVWLDSKAEELPEPLPEWATIAVGDFTRFRLCTPVFIALTVMYFSAIVVTRRRLKHQRAEHEPQQNLTIRE